MEFMFPAPQALLEMIAAGLAFLAMLVGGLLLVGQLAATAQRPGDGAARLPGVVVGLLLALGAAGVLLGSGAVISAGAAETFGRMPQMLGWK